MSEQDRFRAAADLALRRYPGPVGELIHRELSAYATFGRQFTTDVDTLIPHLATHVLTGATHDSVSHFGRPAPGPVLWPSPR
ncbi:hypothetical protein Acsp06_60090 [Actinomycetospora sp. NBRC 106375]|uniref:hypothetical protein n=1 Tax=Actinomycetospora sp. NBRC 106375 TaxID=3032207 RepID=UPI0024A3C64E|nr:hypothetical protein [Actinomycetospora sp. NBRC 106375]GLZ49824.1 hypothetical protein Acsp06_60090 [Actinomycetospora sp. NBRC 106375]